MVINQQHLDRQAFWPTFITFVTLTDRPIWPTSVSFSIRNHLADNTTLSIDIERKNRLLEVCYVPATSATFLAFFSFFLLWPLTVLMKQTRQAVHAVKRFILLRCLWLCQSTVALKTVQWSVNCRPKFILCGSHRYRKAKIDCLSLFMCPLLAQLKIGFFSSFSAAAVYSTNETNKAGLKQSIILRCLWWIYRDAPFRGCKQIFSIPPPASKVAVFKRGWGPLHWHSWKVAKTYLALLKTDNAVKAVFCIHP